MNKRTFYNTFLNRHYGKKIRTAFDACLFLKNDKISLETKTLEPACFDHLYAPWYVNKRGLATTYCCSEAEPVTIKYAAETCFKGTNSPCWSHIKKLVEEFKNGKKLPIIPAVILNNDCYLILDGNHHLTAYAKSKPCWPIVELIAITGDVGPDLVRDLCHPQFKD